MKIIILFVSIISFNLLAAQEFNLNKQLADFNLNNPVEKVYLHTDKEYYTNEETIWFKIYVLQNNKQTTISKIAYVVLSDEKNKIIESKMFSLKNGIANGEFDLNKKLINGNYKISCYTTWILNQPEFIFEKNILISDGKNIANNKEKNEAFNVEIFPESGVLLLNQENKIAIKILDKNKNGLVCKAKLLDSKNNEIENFITNENGNVILNFTPQQNEKYFIKTENNISKEIELATDEGAVLSINNKNENKLFIAIKRGNLSLNDWNKFTLVGIMNNEIIYSNTFNFDEGEIASAINKKTLKTGIIQFTLFNQKGKAVAERLVFNYNKTPDNYIQNFAFNKTAKALQALDIQFPSKNTNASISIVNAKTQPSKYNENILLSCLINSDIRGKINNLSNTITDNYTETINNLEGIVLSNGWRKIDWKSIMEEKYEPLNYYPETDLYISGEVVDKKDKSFCPLCTLNFVMKGEDSTKQISIVKTDTKGNFFLKLTNFRKSAKISYNFSDENKAKNYKINIFPSFYDSLKHNFIIQKNKINSIEQTEIIKPFLTSLSANENNQQLEAVSVKSKRKSKIDSVASIYVSSFYSGGRSILVDEDFAYADIFQMIETLVPGARIYKDPESVGDITVTLGRGAWNNNISGSVSKSQFFLNEIPIDMEDLKTISPNDVILLKLYTDASSGFAGLDAGGLVIYTKKIEPNKNEKNLSKDFVKLGFSYPRVYSQPYWLSITNNETLVKSISDTRTTLLWNPNILLDINGKASLKFANSDNCSSIKICIQGIDGEGNFVCEERNFENY